MDVFTHRLTAKRIWKAKKYLIQDGVLKLTRSGNTVKCNCDIDIRATHTEKTITVLTYLSCKHKQSDEEDEERDGAHGLQVFKNSRS